MNPQDMLHNPLYALRTEERRFCCREHVGHSGEIAEQVECLAKLIFMGVIRDNQGQRMQNPKILLSSWFINGMIFGTIFLSTAEVTKEKKCPYS